MSDNEIRLTGQQAKTVGKQTAAVMTAARNLARRTILLASLVFTWQLAYTITNWDTRGWWLAADLGAMLACVFWVIDGIRTSTVCSLYIRAFEKWSVRA